MSAPAELDLMEGVAAEFLALADLLDGLPDAAWDTPSLCAGWRVREVVAHLTMPARYSGQAFYAELEAVGGDFSRLSNRVAERDGALPTSVLVANLRDEVMRGWVPPGGGPIGALLHVVIHGLDVTVALGVPRRPPDETTRTVLDGLAAGGVHAQFGVSVAGVRLRATDLDWNFGSGTPIERPAGELIVLLGGRELPDGAGTFALPKAPSG